MLRVSVFLCISMSFSVDIVISTCNVRLLHQVHWIMNNAFGGVMVWALDLDDFNNLMGGGRYPLLTAISEALGADITTTTTTPG